MLPASAISSIRTSWKSFREKTCVAASRISSSFSSVLTRGMTFPKKKRTGQFDTDRSVSVCHTGYERPGFPRQAPATRRDKLCPVLRLQDYIDEFQRCPPSELLDGR